jgi:hypothetical protein
VLLHAWKAVLESSGGNLHLRENAAHAGPTDDMHLEVQMQFWTGLERDRVSRSKRRRRRTCTSSLSALLFSRVSKVLHSDGRDTSVSRGPALPSTPRSAVRYALAFPESESADLLARSSAS